MRRRSVRWWALALCGVFGLGVVGCGGIDGEGSDRPDLERIDVGTSRAASYFKPVASADFGCGSVYEG